MTARASAYRGIAAAKRRCTPPKYRRRHNLSNLSLRGYVATISLTRADKGVQYPILTVARQGTQCFGTVAGCAGVGAVLVRIAPHNYFLDKKRADRGPDWLQLHDLPFEFRNPRSVGRLLS
jgi:hypothetical protein